MKTVHQKLIESNSVRKQFQGFIHVDVGGIHVDCCEGYDHYLVD